MKKGFTLIEISIVLLISSIMSLSLYSILRQTQKGAVSINEVIDNSAPLIALFNQLEKDVTGAFIPNSTEKFYIEEEKKKQQPAQEKQNDNKPEKDLDRESKPKAELKKEEKEKHIENIFFVDRTQDELFWSFITTNSISNLTIDKEKKPVLESKPYIARVAYVLKKDSDNPELFKLFYRYSTSNLDLNTLKNGSFKPSYEILSNIKKLDLSFTIRISKKQEENNEPKKNTGFEISQLQEKWEEKLIFEKYKALIPAFVSIYGSTTDSLGIEHDFTFDIPVYGYHNIVVPTPNNQKNLQSKPQSNNSKPLNANTKK